MIPLGLGERAVVLCVGGYLLTKFLGWQIALLIGVAAAILQLWLLRRQALYWSRLGVPGPSSWTGWEVSAELIKQGAHKCDSKWLSEYGSIYGSFFFGHQELCVADRDILKKILVKDFWNFVNRRDFGDIVPMEETSVFARMLIGLKNEEWKSVRNILTPAFTSGKMKAMLPMLQDCVNTFCDVLGTYADEGKMVAVRTVVGNFTIDVIAAVAFGMQENNQRDPNNLFMRKIRELSDMFASLKMVFIVLFPNVIILMRNLFKIDLVFGDLQTVLIKRLKAVLEERRQHKAVRPDFLQLMLNVVDGEENIVESQNVGDSTQITKSKKSLSEFDMLSQSFLFLFAGHESTASTFTYLLHVVAVNPDVQDRIYEEIESIIGNETCTYEHLQKLSYMEAVIQETLRMYSPVVRLDRISRTDYQLNEKITIPRGTIIVIPIYAIHHNPEIYENPFKFDPSRFLNNEKVYSSCEYFAFGVGPRNCIGLRFAQMELKLTLVNVFRKFRVETGAETHIPLEVRTETGFLRPVKPINLYFKRRNH